MELSAQAIREIEFREKLRGYHPDDVDAFVEQVAAEVERLSQRLADAGRRGVASGGDEEISEETLRRTLVMAQRTADMVLSEAQESAAHIVAEARAEADALRDAAHAEAQRLAEAATNQLAQDVARLESAHAELLAEVEALERRSEQQRSRLRELLLDQLALVDEAIAVEPGARDEPDPPDVGSVTPDVGDPLDDDRPTQSVPAVFEEGESDSVDLFARGRDLGAHMPGEGADDPFLTELRRAVEDPEPGPARRRAEDDGSPDAGIDGGEDRGPDSAPAHDSPDAGRLSGRLFRRR